MDEDKADQRSQEETKLNGSDIGTEDDENGTIYSNVQIHGGCGLGAVTMITNKPPKHEEVNSKMKDEGMNKHLFLNILVTFYFINI